MNKVDVRTLGLAFVFIGLVAILAAFYSAPGSHLADVNLYGYKRLVNTAMWFIGIGEVLSFFGFYLVWLGRDKTY